MENLSKAIVVEYWKIIYFAYKYFTLKHLQASSDTPTFCERKKPFDYYLAKEKNSSFSAELLLQ